MKNETIQRFIDKKDLLNKTKMYNNNTTTNGTQVTTTNLIINDKSSNDVYTTINDYNGMFKDHYERQIKKRETTKKNSIFYYENKLMTDGNQRIHDKSIDLNLLVKEINSK